PVLSSWAGRLCRAGDTTYWNRPPHPGPLCLVRIWRISARFPPCFSKEKQRFRFAMPMNWLLSSTDCSTMESPRPQWVKWPAASSNAIPAPPSASWHSWPKSSDEKRLILRILNCYFNPRNRRRSYDLGTLERSEPAAVNECSLKAEP